MICCLSPVCLPHLGRGYVSSVFISYAVCLCRLCSWCLRDGVTLAWVECRCCFLPSIGTKATFLSVLSIPSGWGHPLGQVCFLFPLISIEGSLSFGFCSFRWAPGSGACACHLFLGWASSLASVLLFSVWLHYDLSVFFFLVSSLTRLVGLFRHSFFFGYPCFLSLAASSVLFFLSSFLCGLAGPPVA